MTKSSGPTIHSKSEFSIFNFFFAVFLFKIIDLVGVAEISKQLCQYLNDKNRFEKKNSKFQLFQIDFSL